MFWKRNQKKGSTSAGCVETRYPVAKLSMCTISRNMVLCTAQTVTSPSTTQGLLQNTCVNTCVKSKSNKHAATHTSK